MIYLFMYFIILLLIIINLILTKQGHDLLD